MVDFGFSIKVVGHVKQGTIDPGRSLEDVLVFEYPIERMEHLRLELAGASLGLPHPIRFHIPRSMVEFR